MGTTISFAGKPNIKARRITPSSPMNFANGSRNAAQRLSRLSPPAWIFAIHQIIIPAGAATQTALPRTKTVLSKTERTITCPKRGVRYGGSSRAKLEGIPFKKVFERNFVTATPKTITLRRMRADKAVLAALKAIPAVKNIVIMLISAGKRPLQGTKLFVRIAMSRSLGESIIRQPTTPQALQPNPMHMLREKDKRPTLKSGAFLFFIQQDVLQR